MISAAIYSAPPLASPRISWADATNATLQYSCALAFVAQLMIDRSETNILAAAVVLTSSTLTLQYLGRTSAFAIVPLSSLAVLGLCMTTQWGALVAQSLARTSVSDNLRDPVRTFALLSLFQLIAILAHVIHRTIGPLIHARESCANAFRRLGLFEIPSPGALWLMGAVGFAAYAMSLTDKDVNLGDRLVAGFWPFAWAPFIIPILRVRWGERYCSLRPQLVALAVYLLMAFALAMATNHRVLMAQGVTTAALLALLVALQSERRFERRILWTLVPLGALAVLAMRPLADVATAMEVARADRGHLSPVQLLKETVDVLQDSGAIRRYRERKTADNRLSPYDETYIADAAVARFVETKFHDNSFFFTKDLSDWEREGLEHEMVDRAWSLLPYPVLRGFGVPVDKNIIGHTVGDFYANLRTGVPLGGLKTGSLLADCLGLFGETGAVAYLGLCLALFFVWDSQCLWIEGGGAQISVLAMLQAYRLFTYGITNESLIGALALFVRGFWQNLAFFLLTYSIAKILFPPFRPQVPADLALDLVPKAALGK